MVDLELRDAERMTPDERRTLGRLILSGFPEMWLDDPGVARAWSERAWRTVPAVWHCVALDGRRRPVGQTSVFRLSAGAPLRIYGLGDVVVAPTHRRQGVARRLLELAVETCRSSGAQVICTITVPLARVVADLGFELDDRGRWLTGQDGAPIGCLWVWHAARAEIHGERLAPDDF